MDHCCYWIWGEGHICPWHHGYVGVTKNELSRVKSHLKRLNAVGYVVLLRGTRKECRTLEFALRPTFNIGQNRARGGQKGPQWTSEAIAKLSISKRGIPRSDELKLKLRLANLGKRHTEETKRKLSLLLMGNKRSSNFSAETRKKIGEGQRGCVQSEEEKKKRALKLIGQKRSEITKKIMRWVQWGHSVSEETRRKISIAAKNRKLAKVI